MILSKNCLGEGPQDAKLAKTHVFVRVPGRMYAYLRAKLAPRDEKVVQPTPKNELQGGG